MDNFVLSRRDFLKSTAALAALMALGLPPIDATATSLAKSVASFPSDMLSEHVRHMFPLEDIAMYLNVGLNSDALRIPLGGTQPVGLRDGRYVPVGMLDKLGISYTPGLMALEMDEAELDLDVRDLNGDAASLMRPAGLIGELGPGYKSFPLELYGHVQAEDYSYVIFTVYQARVIEAASMVNTLSLRIRMLPDSRFGNDFMNCYFI